MRSGEVVEIHPRLDQMWVTRREDGLYLSTHRGRHEYRLAPEAEQQLSGMLDISLPLLRRLQSLPRVQDCRLLNLLLWAEGAKKESRFRVVVEDGVVRSVRSPKHASLDVLQLADALATLEPAGLRLRRFDYTMQGLWLEFEQPATSFDLSPVTDRQGSKPDTWRAGAVLFDTEEAGGQLTVVPVLLRAWGGLCLPVMSHKAQLQRHPHRGTSSTELVARAIESLQASAAAPFRELSERMGRLHRELIVDASQSDHLDSLKLPFPTRAARDATLRRIGTGQPTSFRLVTSALATAHQLEEPAARLRLLLFLGRLVWKGPRRAAKPQARD
jgi:hypothetical protein